MIRTFWLCLFKAFYIIYFIFFYSPNLKKKTTKKKTKQIDSPVIQLLQLVKVRKNTIVKILNF